MNARVKKGVIWGVIIATIIFVVNILHSTLGGHHRFEKGPYAHGPRGMGQAGGMMRQEGGFGPHHEGGFPWLLLLIGLAILILVVRWFRKKAKSSAMKQLIDTPLVGSYTPVINQNANILDQWERNVLNKKETD